MMTSKEIIQRIIGALEDDLQHYTMVDKDNVKAKLIKFELEEYNTILKDLERLGQLEKFYKLCVKKYVPLDSLSPKFWQSKEEWLELMSYDYYLFLCDDVCEYVVKDNQRLTLEEFKMIYELLKEVLGNENN